MDLPSFEDFLLDMGEEKIEQWVNNINKEKLEVSLPLTAFNVQSFIQTIVTASLTMSCGMMSDYHQWLCKQLAQRSFHLVK